MYLTLGILVNKVQLIVVSLLHEAHTNSDSGLAEHSAVGVAFIRLQWSYNVILRFKGQSFRKKNIALQDAK